MKYSEILEDVLAGKCVRTNPNGKWIKMGEEGVFYDEAGCKTNIRRDTYDFETWEVKPDEIYIWGFTDASHVNCVECFSFREIKTPLLGADNHTLFALQRLQGESPLFPTDKPQKYKLVPVEDDE